MGRIAMKFVPSLFAAALLTVSFAAPAPAAKYKGKYDIGREASCQWRAKKKYGPLHVLKRRAFIRECMSEER